MNYLFVTGNVRSGTTLLDKLLNSHPRVSLLSQPFPHLYIDSKRAFLDRIGYGDTYHPLSHLFGEGRYTVDDFTRFLRTYRSSLPELLGTFDRMASYSGQLTRLANYRHKLASIQDFDFVSIFKSLHRLSLVEHAGVTYLGSKDVLCEEFVPALLDAGVRCVIIVRDPRAMIASMNFGRSGDWVGKVRPTLFNVRNWRKSVAFCLASEDHPGFAWLRYEDLVQQPASSLRRVAELLDLDDFDSMAFRSGIVDQHGKPWQGNSSHDRKGGVTTDSVEKFKQLLSPSVIAFIEAATFAEMKLLGYEPLFSGGPSEYEDRLRDFREPYELDRPEFDQDYSSQPGHVEAEVERLRGLLDGCDEPRVRPLFIFPRAHERLRAALA